MRGSQAGEHEINENAKRRKTHSLNFEIYSAVDPMSLDTHKLRFTTFLALGIVDQARGAIQGNSTTIQTEVVGFGAALVGKEVGTLRGAGDVSAAWWHPGVGLNVSLQRLDLRKELYVESLTD